MKYKLGEICEIVSGSTPKTSIKEYWDGDVKWITPAELTDDSYIIYDSARKLTELGVKKTGLSPFPAGTVILSSRAPIGKVAIAGCEMYCNQGFKNLICSEKINNKYLYWFLKGNTEFLNSLGRGATFKEISKGIVSNIEINVPDLTDQEKAVCNLEKLSEIIKLRKKELNALNDPIRARFVEMFGDPKINEKGWQEGVISDYFVVKGGKRIPKGMGYSEEVTAHPYLRTTDMKDETILDNDIHYIDEDVFQQIKRYTVQNGDIYLTNVGVNLGAAGVIPEKYDGANLTENAVKLVPKTDLFRGIFIANYINSPGIQDYIRERKMAVGVPKLAIFRIETMPLIVPPLEVQDAFADFSVQVDKSKVAVQKSLDETQLLFNSLMQKYFG